MEKGKSCKRILSCLLAACVMISQLLLGLTLSASAEESEVWDGTKSSTFAGGTGTADDPFLIDSASQIAYIATSDVNGSNGFHYKLMKDIRINDTSAENWKDSARNWVWANYRFVGVFDGDGHTIDGLYYKGIEWKRALFPYIGGNGTAIKNLKFTNASINTTFNGDGGAGIVAAQLSASAEFSRIYVDETCEINAPNANGVAALAPWCSTNGTTVTIDNCAVLANIVGKGYTGAFIGSFWTGSRTVTNCFTASNVPISGNQALTNPKNNYALVADTTDSGTTVLASADDMKGEAAKDNMPGLDFDIVWQTTDGFPTLREGAGSAGEETVEFAGGSGTQEEPYLIETAEQLYKMVADYSDTPVNAIPKSHTYFKITKDIDLAGKSWCWYGAGCGSETYISSVTAGFSGIIDGDGHTISNLTSEAGANYAEIGLIPIATQGAEVHNLTIKSANLSGKNVAGALFSLVKATGSNCAPIVIDRCSVEDSTVQAVDTAGGLVGYIYGQGVKISNSRVVRSTFSATGSGKSARAAAFVGGTAGNSVDNVWNRELTVTTSFCDAGAKPVGERNNSWVSASKFENVYTSNASIVDGITKLDDAQMKGEAAKENLAGFDFTDVWATVEDDYPEFAVYVTPDYVWKGDCAAEFAGGSGTAADPYLIENGAQLYKMVSEYSNASGAAGSKNKRYSFKLTQDIYLNDPRPADLQNPTTASWGSKFHAWYGASSYSTGFCGNLDGDGHTVYGLYSNTGYAGLIPVLLDGGSIRNLNLKNSFVRGWESAGSLVGFVKGHWQMAPVSITYCTVDGVKLESSNKYVGGIVGGYADTKITLSDCAVTRAKLVSTNAEQNFVSGLISTGWGNVVHQVTNCFTDSSVHPITATTDRSSFNTQKSVIACTNVYTAAAKNFNADGVTYVANDDALRGDAAEKTLQGFDFTNDWTTVADDYPAIRQGAGSWRYDTGLPGEVWTGKIARNYAAGDGTKDAPYEIETGGQLALLANDALNGKTADNYYKITADILLNDTSKDNWQAGATEWYTGSWAKAFKGKLDGGYHTISGLYLNKTENSYTDYYGGLFACISKDAVIERLGIVHSHMVFTKTDGSSTYIGAFAGFVDQYEAADCSVEEYPLIRECFADTTVYLDASSCGGMIGCATRPIRVEDSFFTGTVHSTGRGLFGYSKMNTDYDAVLVRNFYAADSSYAVLSNASYDNVNVENCYTSSAQDKAGLTRLFIDRMCGELAKQYMTGFDFETVWTTRASDETPGLRGFPASSYKNVMTPSDITVQFETNCDLLVAPKSGKAYSKLTLPTLTRPGYRFDGWYAFPELDVPFTLDYFPSFDTILYAKWTLLGFAQDFEDYTDTEFDYHEDYEYYNPTSENYSAKYVHGGAKAIHRFGNAADEQDFLLFYADELQVGKTYQLTFYATTDQPNAAVDVSLVYLDWPDVYAQNNGVETLSRLTLRDGDWQSYTFTFLARAKWVAIRTSGGASVYFDDFLLLDSGLPVQAVAKDTTAENNLPGWGGGNGGSDNTVDAGEEAPQQTETQQTEPQQSEPTESTESTEETTSQTATAQNGGVPWWVWVVIGAAVLVVGGGAVTLLLVLQKKKKQRS